MAPYAPPGQGAACGEVEPALQKCPTSQAPLQAEAEREGALPYLPGGQGLGSTVPASQKLPGGQGPTQAAVVRPGALPTVPGVHCTCAALVLPSGQ